jgi:hypothetical protein
MADSTPRLDKSDKDGAGGTSTKLSGCGTKFFFAL